VDGGAATPLSIHDVDANGMHFAARHSGFRLFGSAAVRDSSHKGLRTFCIVARRLSFKAAADELCVTPSAVSHQIKALEQRLQTKLFLRRAQAIVLTDSGAELLAHIDPLLLKLDDVVARFTLGARAARPRTQARRPLSEPQPKA
jgi:hypothetical protein